MSGGDGNSIASSCPSSRSSGNGQTTPVARARLKYPLTAPWLSPRLLAIARCGSLLAYRSRKTSRIWRIDSLSAGIPSPLLGKGTSLPSVENCRRRRPLHPHFGLITITGIDDHDRPESVITFHRIE